MTWTKRFGILAILALLAGCTSHPSAQPPPSSPTASPAGNQAACAYAPINIDTASLPKPVSYPPGYTGPTATATSTVTYGLQELQNPPEARESAASPSSQGLTYRNYDPLVVEYSDPAKASVAGCGVKLRTYDGGLVGPTVRVKAGETLKFTVQNKLPAAGQKNLGMMPGESTTATCTPAVTPTASPPATAATPSAPPDAAITAVPKATSPAPARTAIGGTNATLQEDADLTNLHTHGLHVDPCGKTVNGQFIASDNVLIAYGPGTQQPYEITLPPTHPPGTFWYHAHAHGSTATQMASGMEGALIVEDDPSKLPDSLKNIKEQIMVFQQLFYTPTGTVANLDLSSSNPASWTDSQRRITINGQIVPKITMKPGEVQRWRMIAGTFDKFLQLQLAGHPLNEIAVDSLYLPKVDTWGVTQTVELDSGYRSDVLVKATSTPGTYMLTDNYAGQQSVLAAVVVQDTTPAPPKALPTTAEMQQLAYGWTNGVQNPTLESQWNADPVNQGPVAQRHIQQMVFNFGPLVGPVTETNFAVDGFVYPDGPHRKLVLNRIDKWDLVTNTGPNSNPHLFHIHVNPFQVIRAGPTGPELVWRDTVSVPKENGPSNPLVMYTQYNLFTGGFVIHCHLVDHEDNGMMQEVDVSASP